MTKIHIPRNVSENVNIHPFLPNLVINMNIDNLETIVAIVSTVGSNLVWIINSYIQGKIKGYAAKRDFELLNNNQLQIGQDIKDSHQDIENHLKDMARDILEIKIILGRDKNE